MKRSRELIAQSCTPDGDALTLSVEGGEHVVRVRGETLMSARLVGSEQAMAKLAFASGRLGTDARLCVGGLGMGFTLRAVLDCAAADAHVDVVELLDDVVRWNRGVLGDFAQHPLRDPRVTVVVADLLDHLGACEQHYEAILIDIDNGPEAFTISSNEALYHEQGLALIARALKPHGVVVLWSAFRSDAFVHRLRRAGFDAHSKTVRARGDVGKGARHTLFVAVNAPAASLASPQRTAPCAPGRGRRRR